MGALASKKVYSGIDLFKLIASLLVVLLHATETTDWIACEVKFVITRFAVPFFFIASGFFYYKGLERAKDTKEYFWNYEKNLLKLYAVWALFITLPFTIKSYLTLYSGSNIWKIIFILIRRLFIVGSGPYWYLIAIIFTAPIIYLFHTKRKVKLLGVIAVLCMVLGILYSCFRGVCSGFVLINFVFKVFDFVYSWEFNFVMYGIPFMSIGYFIAKNEFVLPLHISLILFIASTTVRVLEYNLPNLLPSDFWNNNSISISFGFQALAFFMLAKEIVIPISVQVSLTMRQLSSFIYFTHATFMYSIIDSILRVYAEHLIYAPWFILPKMILSLVPCILIFFIIKKINNKHINILING